MSETKLGGAIGGTNTEWMETPLAVTFPTCVFIILCFPCCYVLACGFNPRLLLHIDPCRMSEIEWVNPINLSRKV